ncbi:MAG: hypothetical protein ABSD99_12385 [Candidatus Bathyarchaeia archaeon]
MKRVYSKWMGPDTKQVNRVMAFAGFLLLTLAVVIIVYYAITVPTEGSFGERYVTTVISPPYPLNQITTFKPVTLMTYFVFCGTVFVLEVNKDRLSRVGTRGVRAILLTASFAAGYEFLWNMFAWFTTWLRNGGSLDLTANTFHSHIFPPVNFNFATKVSFLVFALCLYCWHFLQKIPKKETPP